MHQAYLIYKESKWNKCREKKENKQKAEEAN